MRAQIRLADVGGADRRSPGQSADVIAMSAHFQARIRQSVPILQGETLADALVRAGQADSSGGAVQQGRTEIAPGAPAILVVEDDRRMAAFLDRALSYAGYRVSVAEDGECALAAAEAQAPDLVVLDVMLPGIDGLEVARRLRSGSGVPILMLTAREGLDDRIEGLDSGADDYLAKPFALQELLARLRALLRGRALAVAETRRGLLTYADVSLDQDAREATRGERRLTLRNKELELLAYFLRAPERVLEPRTLLEAVWGYPYLGDANLVHVTLRRLRQELEAGGEPRLIQTVPRGGYVLRPPSASTTPSADGASSSSAESA